MDDTVYKMQRRVEQYSTEAQAYQEGDNRISIEIPGVEDANAILEELGQRDHCISLSTKMLMEMRTTHLEQKVMY